MKTLFFTFVAMAGCIHGLVKTGNTVPPDFKRQVGMKANECPSNSPFALDNGQKCCTKSIRSVSCTTGSAGSGIEFEDPVGCCRDTEPQSCGDFACRDNNIVAGEPCNWSEWYSRDTPAHSGDGEGSLELLNPDNGACTTPLQLEARRVSDQVPAESTGEVFGKYDLSGLTCKNADQADGVCDDYEIRMCCE